MPDSRASSCLCDAAVRHAVTSTVAADPAGLMEQNLRGGRASFGTVMRTIRTKCGPSSQEICVTPGLSGRLAYIASKYMQLWFTRGPEASRRRSVISARCRRCASMAMESDGEPCSRIQLGQHGHGHVNMQVAPMHSVIIPRRLRSTMSSGHWLERIYERTSLSGKNLAGCDPSRYTNIFSPIPSWSRQGHGGYVLVSYTMHRGRSW